MTQSKLALLVTLAAISINAQSALAQQRPSPAEAQQMLQTNPALLQQLRQKIMTSGLTPDQVRARLRAEGYPENLLDAYLPGGSGSADSSATTEDVFSAISQLGIADTVEVALLRCGVNTDTLVVPGHACQRTHRQHRYATPPESAATGRARRLCSPRRFSESRSAARSHQCR